MSISTNHILVNRINSSKIMCTCVVYMRLQSIEILPSANATFPGDKKPLTLHACMNLCVIPNVGFYLRLLAVRAH